MIFSFTKLLTLAIIAFSFVFLGLILLSFPHLSQIFDISYLTRELLGFGSLVLGSFLVFQTVNLRERYEEKIN